MKNSRNSGLILILMLLLTVVIGAILYSVMLKGPGIKAGKFSSTANSPWNQWRRLQKKLRGHPIVAPNDQQPEINEYLRFNSYVKEDEEFRGSLSLEIRPNGKISGVWGGDYHFSKEIFHDIISGEFEGNIWPSMLYKDDNGKDPSRLFFIARGISLILEENSDTGRVRRVRADLYVTGWLDTDYYATGKVTITSDNQSFEEFTWEAEAKFLGKPSSLGKAFRMLQGR